MASSASAHRISSAPIDLSPNHSFATPMTIGSRSMTVINRGVP